MTFLKLDSERRKMTFKEFLQWVIEHKDYAPLYSSLVATGAFLFSVLSFIISNIISKNRAKKDKNISDARYEEQKAQNEKREKEEYAKYCEQKKCIEKSARIAEQPYLVYKEFKVIDVIPSSLGKQIIVHMKFMNKGRGNAYSIIPDTEWNARKKDMSEIRIHRYGAVQDPIAIVGEYFEMDFCYMSLHEEWISMQLKICCEDASGRRYMQTFDLDIDEYGSGIIKNFAKPEMCEE